MPKAPKSSKMIIRKPDDMHVHLRSGSMLSLVAPHTAAQFCRAVIMPNLIPPVTTAERAIAYRQEIQEIVGNGFTPLMTLYLTEQTSGEELKKAKEAGVIGCKLYPAGATTNSESGVREIKNVSKQLEAMEKLGLALMMHGEVPDENVADKDREKVFIDKHLVDLVKQFPHLKMVLEHVSTKEGVQFISSAPENIASTCTVHHMMFTDKDLFQNGLNPHLFCKPILKSEEDRKAVVQAATGSSPKFFAGTDSAPHPRSKKETDKPSAGIYSGYSAVELYAQIFDEADMWDGGKLQNLEDFLSTRGAKFYGLPQNQETITITKQSKLIPSSFRVGDDELIPLLAGQKIHWSLL